MVWHRDRTMPIITSSDITFRSSSTGFTCAATANQTALSYTWAADGHLANFTNTQYVSGTPYTNNYSAHWDGDDLLYVASGEAIYLYVEKLAVMLGPQRIVDHYGQRSRLEWDFR